MRVASQVRTTSSLNRWFIATLSSLSLPSFEPCQRFALSLVTEPERSVSVTNIGVSYCSVLHCIILHSIVLYCIMLQCIPLYYIALYYITVHYIALYYIVL